MADADKGLRVTVEELDSGKVTTKDIKDDYVLICAGRTYLASSQVYKNGTHVLTIKEAR